MDTIRMAVKGIVHDHGDRWIAKALDINVSTAHKWAEPSTEMDKHGEIPLRRAIQLTLVTGDTRLMDAIAEEAGGLFVPGHQLVEGRFDSEKCALKVMKEASDLIQAYIAALDDGKVSPAEYAELTREAMRLHQATAAIIESARQKAGL
jgi:hypothetical protein